MSCFERAGTMTRILSALIVPALLLSACGEPANLGAAPKVASTPAATPVDPSTTKTFEEIIATFDAGTQHLVWVLPPGVVANGPYSATVVVQADGQTEFEMTIPLMGEKPAAGSHHEYPAEAEVLRLSTDATYPQRLEEIRGVMKGVTDRLGPGHGELIITSDFKTQIADAYRETYCTKRELPPTAIYLEHGTPSTLQKLPIGGGEAVIQSILLASCAAPPT